VSEDSNLPLWKASRRVADAEASVNSDALTMGLPKMRVLNVAKVGQTDKKPSPLPIGKMHKQGLLPVPSSEDVY
jgi:hypothetical protein